MPQEEFWHGPPRLAGAYREAYAIRRDNEHLSEWRLGLYFRDALLNASPALAGLGRGMEHEYPERPYQMQSAGASDEEREGLERMERDMAAVTAFAVGFNRRFEEKAEGE